MTLFSSLYSFIRYEVLRTNNADVLPNTDLDLAIENVLEFEFNGYSVVTVDGKKQVTPELSKEQRQLLILKTSFSLMLPEDSFSYRSASFSKFLEGIPGLEQHKEELRRRIRALESGGTQISAVSSDEFGLYHNQSERLQSTLTKAENEG